MIKNRPFLVTLFCLYLLGMNSYHLITSFAYLNDPDTQTAMQQVPLPYPVQVAMLYLNLVTSIVSAMFIMQEANWARWLYVGWGPIYIGYTFHAQPVGQSNLIGLAIYICFALILFLPSANAYFSSKSEFD